MVRQNIGWFDVNKHPIYYTFTFHSIFHIFLSIGCLCGSSQQWLPTTTICHRFSIHFRLFFSFFFLFSVNFSFYSFEFYIFFFTDGCFFSLLFRFPYFTLLDTSFYFLFFFHSLRFFSSPLYFLIVYFYALFVVCSST